MDEIWTLTDFSLHNGQEPEEVTIRGEKFHALMDLCFAHADRFSLHRCNYPGANDGALEQALRPFCLGEYRSYAAIYISEDKKLWENCYLYPATDETKAILLQYIPHLFGRESNSAPEGHAEYLEKKYAAYYRASNTAVEQINQYLKDYNAQTGHDPDIDTFISVSKKAHCETRTIWKQIFDPKDYYSIMEDPCFFRGNEMFFETITHERECYVHIFSEEFGAKLRELGDWLDCSDRLRLPLFSLRRAKKLVWYRENRL